MAEISKNNEEINKADTLTMEHMRDKRLPCTDDYECDGQINIFDLTMPMIHIDKPIRLIELFAGYGSQAMALKRIGAKFEHWKVCEFDKYAVASYNAVHETDFVPTDIKNLHGKDLDITETDKYCYMMTYSFPCTDLSVAGKMAGMKKGSGTRSGLLWEVERLLTEIHESNGELPQILFMENVPQVIAAANIKDFRMWQKFLTELGYTNYLKVLNAKDYGVAQNRERCYMFSFLGKYNYHFPEPVPLTKTMKDYLDPEVDEKYYINSEKAQKLIDSLIERGEIVKPGLCKFDKPYKEDGSGFTSMDDASLTDFDCKYSSTVTARYYKGIGANNDNVVLEKAILTPKRTEYGKEIRKAYESGVVKESRHNMTQLEPRTDGISNTLATVQKDNMVLESVRIKQATKDGYIDCKIGGVADLSFPTSDTRRGRVQDNGDTCPTITATETGICRIENLYRIRKLTPRECGRLMDVSDEDITKMELVNSNSQLYKQFGNSIVVGVMVAMFKNLNIDRR